MEKFKLVSPEEIQKAYAEANFGDVHGPETTLEDLLGMIGLGKPREDPPW